MTRMRQAFFVLWDDHPAQVESIWLTPLGRHRYRVETVPFWAYNLSRGDIVDCHPDEDGLGLFVGNVLEKSGHRTVRVAFQSRAALDSKHARLLLLWLRQKRIAFERCEPRMISIDLKTERAYDQLVNYLESMPRAAKMISEDADPQPKHGVGGADVERRRTPRVLARQARRRQIKSTRKRAPRTT